MRGGLIQISGNAGDLVGAAYRGSKRGMTDGTILIGGNAGNEIGVAMRRGMIAVQRVLRRRGRIQHDRRQHPGLR